jgi:hypothetical protein
VLIRGYIEYLGKHQLGTRDADLAWHRVEAFLRELTDAGEPREAVLRVWDGAAALDHEQALALQGKSPAEMAPYVPAPAVSEALASLGPGEPHLVDGGLYFEWEAEPEREDFGARWRRFRDFVRAHAALPLVRRGPLRSRARAPAVELELRHRFRLRLPGAAEVLPFQEPGCYLDEWVASSQLTTLLGTNRVVVQLNFPFERAGEELGALWRGVGRTLGVELRPGRLRVHQPNRDGTRYRARRLVDFAP